ncbi:MAG: truA [Nevskia sp.]|nr:truA [Nevskia sp.]
MTRWAASVEYLGTRFSGWQTQAGRDSVQATLEAALSKVAAHPVSVIAAGRTDAGVHALGQVVHFDSASLRTPYAWVLGSNSNLPPDISLGWIMPVADHFDARRSATLRRYRYVIRNLRARSALLTDRVTWVPQPLDADAMHRAAQALLGEHDFSAFRAAECQSSTPMRKLREIAVFRQHEFVVLDVCANAFLHHMVRNIAGSLIEIGKGRQTEPWAAELLAGRDRTKAAMTAAARGLYFLGPEYPPQYQLPPPARAWFP